MKTEVIQLYEDRNDVTLTTYILQDSPELLAGKERPAVLICPGGGYFYCSDREAEPVALKFASMGYHAFVLRYSTYCGETKRMPNLAKPIPVNENCKYPNALREIGEAMRIIREHAKTWLVDMDKIAVCGFSAGAHNAAMYATHWQEEVISGYFQEEKEMFRPAALILGYVLSDYVYMKEAMKDFNSMNRRYFEGAAMAYLGEADPSEEILDQVSPARHVTGDMPPTFLWATAEDSLVPVQHSLCMSYALAEKNIPFELHIFEKGSHGLALADQSSARTQGQINSDAAKWAELAGNWLEKRFALPIEE